MIKLRLKMAVGLLALLIAAIFIFILYPKMNKQPLKEEIKTEKAIIHKRAPEEAKKIRSVDKVPEVIEGELKPEEQSIVSTEAGPEIPSEKKYEGVHLVAEPKEIKAKVEEGQSAKAELILTNDGTKESSVNIYKSNQAGSGEEASKEIEEMLDYKKEVFSKEKEADKLPKAALFTGTPWLMQYPWYCVLEPGESKTIQLTFAAKNLETGEYKANLYALGQSKQESLIIPVLLEVIGAPRIKLTKIEIDDGFSAGTKGNSNNVANAGEIVALNLDFENQGDAPAEDLTMEAMPLEPSVKILNEGVIKLPYAGAKGKFSQRFLIEVSSQANPDFPPSLKITITDRDGKKWTESFYVGEPGKFEYPTGALEKK